MRIAYEPKRRGLPPIITLVVGKFRPIYKLINEEFARLDRRIEFVVMDESSQREDERLKQRVETILSRRAM